VVALLASVGCAATLSDPTGKHNALEWAQREYTQRVRWGDVNKASEYVDAARRDEFVAAAPIFDRIRITDYEIGPISYTGEGDDAAEVTVTYRAYSLATLVEMPIREEQKWRRSDGLGNDWWVESEISKQLAALTPATP